jgi:D-glycero-alpha-D-manno-heptose-7-phosphate kinase
MIITRSPLRITLGGGGTDLPSYYRHYGGSLISAAIDKYVFVTVTRPFIEGVFLKYSQIEHVEQVEQVEHPIIREALRHMQLKTPQIEITTLADIPAGTGLGSSGSFTTALLKALYAHRRMLLHPHDLAELACHLEIDVLGEPIGKQDQYAAAYGGVNVYTFHPNDEVTVTPLTQNVDDLHTLQDHLLLFFTGFSRSASSILIDQKTKSEAQDTEMLRNLHHTKALGQQSYAALKDRDYPLFGAVMHDHWMQKKSRTLGMSYPKIDAWYDIAMQHGAYGGKLVGAGGGGFLLFCAEDPQRLRRVMVAEGLEEVRFHFDFEGTKVVMS